MTKGKATEQVVWKRQIADDMQDEFKQTLPEKIERFSQIDTVGLIPYHHFAPASAESILLFRDGHFYGCIALVQSVSEALIRFLCRKNCFKPEKVFEKNIEKLCSRNFISSEAKKNFLKIWEKRDDYHHLNPGIETERKALEELAKEKIILLGKIEKEVFSFNINKGKIIPRYPKYWEGCDYKALLRFNPITRWVFKEPKAPNT